ncbi:MAG: DUF4115 domain-containing protein [Gammaproteobacteria bacterium]|nr:DUF4115 domain-containing protein [Gammaproteobacteria bacterium]
MTTDRDQSADTAEQDAVLTPGERLKQAREVLDLSSQAVSEQLYLDLRVIEALERGELENIGAPVFVNGYLRAYARLVGLPEADIVSGCTGEPATQAPVVEPCGISATRDYGRVPLGLSARMSVRGRGRNGARTFIIAAVVPVLLFGVYGLWKGDAPSQPEQVSIDPQNDAINIGKLALPELDSRAKMSTGVEPLASEEPSASEGPSASEKPSIDNEPARPTIAQGDTGSDMANDSHDVGIADPAMARLELEFSEDSWIEITDARGKRLMFHLGKAGTRPTVRGVPPFEVKLGYLPGVRVIYNGEFYDLSRFEGRRQARFRVGARGDN